MSKRIVLDANILIRAVLGKRVYQLIQLYAERVTFLSVEEAFEDAAKHAPGIVEKFGGDAQAVRAASNKLSSLRRFVQTIPESQLTPYVEEARERLRGRDEEDWPYLALALLLDCPIWTEDNDFFGAGVAVWTSSKVELFLKA